MYQVYHENINAVLLYFQTSTRSYVVRTTLIYMPFVDYHHLNMNKKLETNFQKTAIQIRRIFL